jgi:hypothetical protein
LPGGWQQPRAGRRYLYGQRQGDASEAIFGQFLNQQAAFKPFGPTELPVVWPLNTEYPDAVEVLADAATAFFQTNQPKNNEDVM